MDVKLGQRVITPKFINARVKGRLTGSNRGTVSRIRSKNGEITVTVKMDREVGNSVWSPADLSDERAVHDAMPTDNHNPGSGCSFCTGE